MYEVSKVTKTTDDCFTIFCLAKFAAIATSSCLFHLFWCLKFFLSLNIYLSSLKTEEINERTVEDSVEVFAEDSQPSKKQKKRKKASSEPDEDIKVSESVEIAETELPPKKKKKKRKKELESIEKAVDRLPEECPDEKPKKRKKKKKSSDST